MTKRPPSKFPWLKNKLELVATKNIQYSNNIFRFIFCPATYILSFFLMIVYILKNNLKEELIPLYFLIILYLSILIGPVVVVRYVYPFMIIVPLLFIRLLSKSQK